MPKKRFSDEQIAFALRQAEAGTTVSEICRKMGIAEATFYRWKKVYAGMGLSEIRRLKQLEDENGKLSLRCTTAHDVRKTLTTDMLRMLSYLFNRFRSQNFTVVFCMPCNLFQRCEPDVSLCNHGLKMAFHFTPARQSAGQEWV